MTDIPYVKIHGNQWQFEHSDSYYYLTDTSSEQTYKWAIGTRTTISSPHVIRSKIIKSRNANHSTILAALIKTLGLPLNHRSTT
jgi:hypothetical protein